MILDAWGWCTGTTQRDGKGREEGSGWGTLVYLWQIHVDIWQNQYNIVNLKNEKKKERKKNGSECNFAYIDKFGFSGFWKYKALNAFFGRRMVF